MCLQYKKGDENMACICLENGKCVIEEFILEGASCLPEQAINPPGTKEISHAGTTTKIGKRRI